MRKSSIVHVQVIFCCVLLSLVVVSGGCRLLHPDSKSKVEKKQALESKKALQEYEKAKKQLLKNQNKETLRMMKKTKKRATIVNKPKKRGILSKKKCN